jgi:multimeric flavodoxin WrbA
MKTVISQNFEKFQKTSDEKTVKKITVILGSARKKFTYNYSKEFVNQIKSTCDIECEFVFLHNFALKPCIGCKLCMDKGEEFCPLRDDRDILLEKIKRSDAIVIATPNYSFQVSGVLKMFLDRFGFLFHRPRHFGKIFTCIVTEGMYGGNDIVKYLDRVGSFLGCNVVPGIVLKTLEPLSDSIKKKNKKMLRKHVKRFQISLNSASKPKLSLIKLILFRMSRISIQLMLDESYLDYRYYRDQGWFTSDYYYPVNLRWPKKYMGRIFDGITRWMTDKPSKKSSSF